MIRLLLLLISSFVILGCNLPSDNTKPTHTSNSDSEAIDTTLYNDDRVKRTFTTTSQLVYVPVYSHIYQKNRQRTFNLTATLSIRNADPTRTLHITEVDYFDSQGNLVERYIQEPVTLSSLSSTSYVIEESDLRGGVGANFMVRWKSDQPIYPPVIEAVMISTSMQQGLSLISPGRVIEQY